jgi:hypothetical protein
MVQPSGQRSDVVGLSKQGGVGVACDMERRGWASMGGVDAQTRGVLVTAMNGCGGVVWVPVDSLRVSLSLSQSVMSHVCAPSGKTRESAQCGLVCVTSGSTPLNFGSH